MREILFRGKCSHSNKWFEGESLLQSDKFILIAKVVNLGIDERGILNAIHNSVFYDVIPETVGQYTGWTDKNGKKIFEGDIVSDAGKHYEVKMRKGCWVVWNDAEKLEYHKCDFLNTFAPTVEVIGNTHDNPELLKRR